MEQLVWSAKGYLTYSAASAQQHRTLPFPPTATSLLPLLGPAPFGGMLGSVVVLCWLNQLSSRVNFHLLEVVSCLGDQLASPRSNLGFAVSSALNPPAGTGLPDSNPPSTRSLARSDGVTRIAQHLGVTGSSRGESSSRLLRVKNYISQEPTRRRAKGRPGP